MTPLQTSSRRGRELKSQHTFGTGLNIRQLPGHVARESVSRVAFAIHVGTEPWEYNRDTAPDGRVRPVLRLGGEEEQWLFAGRLELRQMGALQVDLGFAGRGLQFQADLSPVVVENTPRDVPETLLEVEK